MFKYVVFAQNGRGRWQLMRETAQPESPYYFHTVLSLSHDPDTISGGSKKADSYIQYMGPMYFDLDGEDQGAELEAVIADAKRLVQNLMLDYTLHQQDLRIFLTGGRGLHIEIDPAFFGLTKPQVKLPKIWGAFANRFKSDYIDRSIYSMGRGRMWRVPGMQRTNGKYKVQISYEELLELKTEEQYDQLCSVPRPALASNPPKVNKYLQQEFDRMRAVALAEEDEDLYAHRDHTQSVLRNVKGVPGCVEKLITEGDCPDSNWNQAAMQVAAYVSGRYQHAEKEDYWEEVVDPFLHNVESGSRPTYGERRSAMEFLLDKAFSGSIQFYVGALIKVLGKPCGNCVICSSKPGSVSLASVDEDDIYMDYTPTNILSHYGGTYRLSGEGKKTQLMIGGIKVLQMSEDMFTGEPNSYQVTVDGTKPLDIELRTLATVKEFNQALMTRGFSFLGTDGDLKRLAQAIQQIHKQDEEVEIVLSSTVAGIQMREVEMTDIDGSGMPIKVRRKVPYLVARDGVFTATSDAPPIVSTFLGREAWTPPYLKARQLRREDVPELQEVLSNLLKINEPFNVMTIMGFMGVSHYRAHLREMNNSFPLLNLNGTSETGKSSTLFLMHTLNGFEYGSTPVWNAEVDTPFPLEEMVSTSTTFVRVIEEVNEGTAKKNWAKLTGVLKAAWDGQGIDKGMLVNGQATSRTLTNLAPIVFLSEQPHPVDSVRARSVVCRFRTDIVRDPAYATPFRNAAKKAVYLEMLGRVLITRAVSAPLEVVQEKLVKCEGMLREDFQARSHTMYSYLLLGLMSIQEALTEVGVDTTEYDEMFENFVAHLNDNSKDLADTRKASRLDEIVSSFDTMAYESENPNHGLEAGNHYWKTGGTLYFDPRIVFPRYRRFLQGIGQIQTSSIVSAAQFQDMLEREDYYKGVIQHPTRPRSRVVMLDLRAMDERNIATASYEDSLPDGGQ